MLRPQPLQAGKLLGTVYDFEVSGDVLPMHSHDASTEHISIIARGSFRCHGPKLPERVLHCGEVAVDVGLEHEFVALEDNSRLVNIIKSPSQSPDAAPIVRAAPAAPAVSDPIPDSLKGKLR